MWRNVIKFCVIGCGIALIGVGALSVIQYVRYRNSPDYEALKQIEKLKKEYAEDPYGGDTPEETLRLFVEALKKGDTDLAAKYFVLDKQEEWRQELTKIKEKNLLGEMVRDLESEKFKYTISEKVIGFDVANEEKEAILSISVVRAQNNKWKIQDL